MTRLTPGDAAPPFALSDQHGGMVHLEDFRGGPLLVFFYPAADTPGCTTQSCEVRDHRQEFDDLGVQVVGISPDEPADQLAFDQKYSLGFPLLADTDHSVAEAWGVWGEKTLYGNTYLGIVRSSFLVDAEGRIAHAWYRVQPAQTVPKAMAALRG